MYQPIPDMRTEEHILKVMRGIKAWRGAQRIAVLKACDRALAMLRARNSITPSRVAVIRGRLLPMLKLEEETLASAQKREFNATDAAKRHAEALGVDLADVNGTGKGGKVTSRDVEATYRVSSSK